MRNSRACKSHMVFLFCLIEVLFLIFFFFYEFNVFASLH